MLWVVVSPGVAVKPGVDARWEWMALQLPRVDHSCCSSVYGSVGAVA
jgi:hypothetical protein